MSEEESTTPDPIELTRSFYETMDREWDFGKWWRAVGYLDHGEALRAAGLAE